MDLMYDELRFCSRRMWILTAQGVRSGDRVMERKKIYFGSVDNALRFVQKSEKTQAMMRLVSGSKIVNAKSLLGVFTLDLSKTLTLEVSGDEDSRSEAIDAVRDYIKE